MTEDSRGTKGIGIKPTTTGDGQEGKSQYASGFYGQSVTSWQHKPTGPTNENILELVKTNRFDLSDDVKEFSEYARKSEPFSCEKVQYQYLLSEICKSDADLSVRRQAATELIRTSDVVNALCSLPGFEELLKEFYLGQSWKNKNDHLRN